MKKVVFIILGIIIFGFGMYQISLWTQKRNWSKYGTEFNSERKNIGLAPLSKYWNSDEKTWNDWDELSQRQYTDNTLLKLLDIFSLSDIPILGVYDARFPTGNGFHKAKGIWLNSNLLFWRNSITSEMDIYERRLDSVTEGRLFVRYHFHDDHGNSDYFEADFYLINENDPVVCGTPLVMERKAQQKSRKPYFGNITKKKADSILESWRE